MAGFESVLGNGGERPVCGVSVDSITATLIAGENKYAHHENDTLFVAEHVIGVVLFLGGDLGGRLDIDDDDFSARARIVQLWRGVLVPTGTAVAVREPDRPKSERKVSILHAHWGAGTIVTAPKTTRSVDTAAPSTSSPAPWEPGIRPEAEGRATASRVN